MYTLKMQSPDGFDAIVKAGKYPELLSLARDLHNRLGMVGDIYRPDGTSVRQPSLAWGNLFYLQYPIGRDYVRQ